MAFQVLRRFRGNVRLRAGGHRDVLIEQKPHAGGTDTNFRSRSGPGHVTGIEPLDSHATRRRRLVINSRTVAPGRQAPPLWNDQPARLPRAQSAQRWASATIAASWS